MEEVILENGLKIVFHRMPNVHSVSVSLYVSFGSRDERPNEYGISHMLEHIHFRELNDLSQKDIYYLMESIGGTLSGSTYADFLRFHIKVRPIYFPNCINLFRSILDANHWSLESVEKEKIIVLNEIYEKDSYLCMDDYIKCIVFGRTNRIIGYENSVRNFDSKMLSEHKKNIFSTQNMLFCVFGNIDNNAIDIVRSTLSSVCVYPVQKNKHSSVYKKRFLRSPDITFVMESYEFMDVCLSFDIDYEILTLGELKILNCILGEGVGSRLQMRIREELGFCYDIYSNIECYNDCAALHIRFSIQKKDLMTCVHEIIKVINGVKRKITIEDLQTSLPFYKENKDFLFDDPEEYSWIYAYNKFILQKDDSVDCLNCDNATANRLMSIARNIFLPRNTSLIVMGNYRGISKKSLSHLLNQLNTKGRFFSVDEK